MKKTRFLFTPVLAFLMIFMFSFGASAAGLLTDDWLNIKTKDGTTPLVFTDMKKTVNLAERSFPVYKLTIPAGVTKLKIEEKYDEYNIELMFSVKDGVLADMPSFHVDGINQIIKGSFDVIEKGTTVNGYIFANKSGIMVFFYCEYEKVPAVKSMTASGLSNYVGNDLHSQIGATFDNTTDATPAKIYITTKKNGKSTDAVPNKLVETTVKDISSNYSQTTAPSLVTKDLKPGKYFIGIEVGTTNQYVPFTMYDTAENYAKAARENIVKWYKEKGFYSGNKYIGLSGDTGADTGIDWEAYIFGALGYNAKSKILVSDDNKTYLDMKAEKFSAMTKEQLMANDGSAPASKILGRQILGIAALGGDPRNIGGKDLVNALISVGYENHDIAAGDLKIDRDDCLKVRLAANDAIAESYFLLALEVANATPEEGYTEALRTAGLKALIRDCGSLDYSETSSGISDFYAMALYPLYSLNDVKGYEGEAQKVLETFKKNYALVIAKNSQMNLFSIAVSMSSLVSGGVNFSEYTTDAKWQRNGASELSYLLKSQMANGGIGTNDVVRMATYETLQGLTDITKGKTCFEAAHETYMKAYPQYSEEVAAVKAAIAKLPGTITLENKNAVVAVRADYDKLTDAQKKIITDKEVKVLTDAEAKIAALEKEIADTKPEPKPDTKPEPQPETPVTDIKNITDIKSTDWFYNDVAYCLAKGIFKGTSATTFGAQEAMTRAQFVTTLGRYNGVVDSSATNPGTSTFADVDNNAYYAAHVTWAVKKDIVQGMGDNKFSADATITREDMATMMLRYANAMKIALPAISADKFVDDGNISEYAKDAVYTMKAAKVINGKEGNIFDPKGSTLRSEVAAVLHRFLEIK
ncbi:MAG: S-layer homology domain-containing protein [Clostridiales bacterium]